MRHHEIDRRENVKFIVTNFKGRFTSYITTTYPNMFSFGLLSVISKVFVADFGQVLFCWKRYSTKPIVVLILKFLAQQTNSYSKSAAETLKANSRDCASLLTTCSMSKTLFECFLVYYKHVFMFLLLRLLLRCLDCQF